MVCQEWVTIQSATWDLIGLDSLDELVHGNLKDVAALIIQSHFQLLALEGVLFILVEVVQLAPTEGLVHLGNRVVPLYEAPRSRLRRP